MLQLNPKNDLAYFTRGLVHDSLENHRQAAKDYSQYIDVNSNDAIAYNNRGKAYADLQEYQKALDSFTEAIQLIKEDEANLAAIYVNSGHCRLLLDDRLGTAEDY